MLGFDSDNYADNQVYVFIPAVRQTSCFPPTDNGDVADEDAVSVTEALVTGEAPAPQPGRGGGAGIGAGGPAGSSRLERLCGGRA